MNETAVVPTVSTELTKSDVFKPTAGMQLWLITAIQLESDSITDIAAACQMSRTAWYEWLDKEGFIEWFRSEWDRKLSGSAWKLDAIGLKNAKRDHKYWQDMQKRVGNLTEKANVAVQVNNILPDEQLDRIIS